VDLQALEFITSPQSLCPFVTFIVAHIVIEILQASTLTSPNMVFQCVDNNIIDIDNVVNNKNQGKLHAIFSKFKSLILVEEQK
jgi:hypothetical protein